MLCRGWEADGLVVRRGDGERLGMRRRMWKLSGRTGDRVSMSSPVVLRLLLVFTLRVDWYWLRRRRVGLVWASPAWSIAASKMRRHDVLVRCKGVSKRWKGY